MLTNALKWLTNPNAFARKRTIAAIAAVIAGALRGASPALHKACEAADLVGAACSFNTDGLAAFLDGFVQWLNVYVLPGADLVTVVMAAWGLWSARNKKAIAVPVLILLALLIPFPAAAQEAASAQEAAAYSLTAGSTTLVTSGPRKEYFTSRLALRVFTDHRTTDPEESRDSLRVRATLTASQDAGAVALGSPDTFQSIVPEIEYRRTISGTLQAAVIGNVTFSAEGGSSNAPLDPRMFGAFAGIRGTLSNGTWLFAGAGKSGPVGPEFALVARGGRPVGKGDVAFEYVLPLRADALRNKAWVLQLTTTYQVAAGDLK